MMFGDINKVTGFELLAIQASAMDVYIQTEANILAKLMAVSPQALAGDEEDELSYLLQLNDDVALIDVKGSLTNRDSWYNRYFGAVSYNEIRKACIQAVEHGASAILFNWSSPGGAVAGMADTANLIASLPVPTVSFTGSTMASACYFLGCQADHVYADSFAEVGSIGIVAKLYDRSKMLHDIGISPKRFRSGSLKAVGDSDFKLSKDEEKHIQGQVDTYAELFFGIVEDATGLTRPVMDAKGITSGRTFIGQESAECLLVDDIRTFDESMLKAVNLAEKEIDKKNSRGIGYVSH